ncbi:hypothetical protein J6590_060582 [Homalodisca vitripennis]|nr:hypothetical protein J6590_060582 [Homalodisca vitripennis]
MTCFTNSTSKSLKNVPGVMFAVWVTLDIRRAAGRCFEKPKLSCVMNTPRLTKTKFEAIDRTLQDIRGQNSHGVESCCFCLVIEVKHKKHEPMMLRHASSHPTYSLKPLRVNMYVHLQHSLRAEEFSSLLINTDDSNPEGVRKTFLQAVMDCAEEKGYPHSKKIPRGMSNCADTEPLQQVLRQPLRGSS